MADVRVSGHVTAADGSSGAGLQIAFWPAEPWAGAPLATAVTSTAGGFEATFDATELRRRFGGDAPTLRVSVARGRARLYIAEGDPLDWLAGLKGRATVTLATADPVAPPASGLILQGHVRNAAGDPLAGITLRALRLVVGARQRQVGRGVSDAEGAYRLTCASETPASPTVAVAVDGKTELARSGLICDVAGEVTADLLVSAPNFQSPPEYTQLIQAVTPLLGDVGPKDLSDADLPILQCAARQPAERVAAFRAAAQIAGQTPALAPVAYGLIRVGLSATRQALFGQPEATLATSLAAAVAARIIEPLTPAQIDAAIAGIAELRLEDLLTPENPSGLSPLLSQAAPDASTQQAILRAYAAYAGDPEAFWSTALAGVAGLETAAVRDRVKLAVGLGAVTFGHAPLAAALLSAASPVEIANLADLAKLQVADWQALIASKIDGTQVGAPTSVPGATPAEQMAGYAADVAQNVAAAFPTAALAAALARSGVAPLRSAGDLLDKAPDFDLTLGSVAVAFGPGNSNEDTAARNTLLALQRILKVTPNADEVVALHQSGFQSAWQIARANPAAVAAATAGAVSPDRAETVFADATARVLTILHVAARFGPGASGASSPAVQTVAAAAADNAAQAATLESLFGPDILCDCEEFEALDGFWAYFCSMLYFLPGGAGSARAELQARRPDLWDLRFSKANAETNDRYLSLALEILEDGVADRAAGAGAPTWTGNQTTWSAAQLVEGPQYTNASAYTALATATFPWSLPFDQPAEEARAFADDVLGVRRADVMETFRNPAMGAPSDVLIARERLHLTSTGWDLVANAAGDTTPAAAYPGVTAWPITDVATFVQVTGLKPSQVVDIFNCRFINPPDAPRVGLDTGDTCNAQTAKITGAPDAGFFGRIHRFVRLWRATGWHMRELDRAIFALGGNTLDAGVLTKLGALVRVRAQTAVPLAELLTWWAPLDAVQDTPEPSQVERLFPGLLALVAAPVAPSPAQIMSSLLAGLGVGLDDLLRLTGGASSSAGDITIPFLSDLYRNASLARALKLSIDDAQTVLTLVGATPFDSPMAATSFFDVVGRLQASGFTLGELRYLLRGEIAPDSPVTLGLTAADAVDFGNQLRTASLALAKDPAAARENAAVARVAAKFAVAPDVAAVLLDGPFKVSATNAVTPLAYLSTTLVTGAPFSAPPVGQAPAGPLADLLGLLQRLDRQALLADRLALSGDELAGLQELAAKASPAMLDPAALPLATFAALEPWLVYRRLADAQLAGASPLLDMLTGPPATPVDWVGLAAALNVPAADVEAAATANGIVAFDPPGLVALSRAMDLLRASGLDGATAVAWMTDPVDSAPIIAAARAVAGEAQWAARAKPIRDTLLGRQRDALLAYLHGAGLPGDLPGTFPTALDVRDRYLIDFKTGPQVLTTRLGLARSSVQLFIDRCFRGQEPVGSSTPFHLGEDLAEQWKTFQGQYRFWQAAVDIYLTPWAYADVSFLDRGNDRFQAFTQALAQTDVTRDTVSDALHDYLEGLLEVSRLEIAGMVEDTSGAVPVMHVLGRTTATPPTYYYAKREDLSWTPWRQVSADINAAGASLMMAVYHGRVFAIWPIIATKADATQDGSNASGSPVPPTQHPEIQIGWSVLKNGVWSAKQVSDTITPDDWLPDVYPTADRMDRVLFRAAVSQAPDDPLQQELRITLSLWSDVIEADWASPHDWLAFQASGSGFPAWEQVIEIDGGAPEFVFSSCTTGPTIRSRMMFGGEFQSPPGTGPWNGFLLSADDRRLDTSGAQPNSLTLYQCSLNTPPGVPNDANAWPTWPLIPQIALKATPTTFQLTYAANFGQPAAQSLFFSDNRWTFFFDYIPQPILPIAIYHPLPGATIAGQLATTFLGAKTAEVDDAAALTAQSGGFARLQADRAAGTRLTYDTPLFPIVPPPIYLPIPPILPIIPIFRAPTYRAYTFCHPAACSFVDALDSDGLEGVWRRDPTAPIQAPTAVAPDFFATRYQPTQVIDGALAHRPNGGVEFSDVTPFGPDNQNVFYYCVAAAAAALTASGRFDDAEWVWRAIFDPMDGSADPIPTRYWKYEPLRAEPLESINDLYGLLSADPDTAAAARAAVKAWAAAPFDPWAVASHRNLALMKVAVRGYLLNLLAQADQFFAQASEQEMLARAADAYIRALEILGPASEPLEPTRPEIEDPDDYHCFAEIEGVPADPSLPEILESALPPLPNPGLGSASQFPFATSINLLFCIPRDKSFDVLRQRAETKLNYIRASLNFNGQPTVYSVFGARLDPGLLARGAALGIDLTSGLNAPAPPASTFRFAVLLQRAKEFVGELRALSGSLLGALTSDSAETFAELRAGHEVTLLAATEQVKEQALVEAQQTLAGLQAYQDVLTAREAYYSSRQTISPMEAASLQLTQAATALQVAAGIMSTTAGVVAEIPDFVLGVSGAAGSPVSTASLGGRAFSGALAATAGAYNIQATALHGRAGAQATLAGYQRRADDWQMLATTTALELEQVAAQIAAQQARVAVAQADLAAFQLQQSQAAAVKAFLVTRINNPQFRSYMISQLSTVVHQGYLTGFALAQAAERAYLFERGFLDGGPPKPSYIQFGYWQNNFNGMTAAEQLSGALGQLESALTFDEGLDKPLPTIPFSLGLVDPGALEQLRRTGTTGLFTIPEVVFGRFIPEAFFLRIRRLKVEIPFVAGPYTPVQFKVRMNGYNIRLTGKGGGTDAVYSAPAATAQDFFYTTGRPDEPEPAPVIDGQYRPFEGAGAADLQLEISFPPGLADLYGASIADVLLEFDLTCRIGSAAWAEQQAKSAAAQPVLSLVRLTTDFPTAWYQALHPAAGQQIQINVPLTSDLLPYSGGNPVTLKSLAVMAVWNVDGSTVTAATAFSASLGGAALAATALPAVNGLPTPADPDKRVGLGWDLTGADTTLTATPSTLTVTLDATKLPPAWRIGATPDAVNTAGLVDFLVLLGT